MAPQSTSASTSFKSSPPSVLLWTNPARSGLVLVQFLVVATVLRYGQPLRFLLKGSALSLFALAAVEHVSRLYSGGSQGWVNSIRPSRYLNVSDAQREKIAHKIAGSINCALSQIHATIDVVDTKHTALVALVAGLMYALLGFVSLTTLMYVAIIGAFSIPKLYSLYQPEIDQALDKVRKHAGEKYNDVHSQVMKHAGPHINQAKSQVNALASKVGYSRPAAAPATVKTEPVVSKVSDPEPVKPTEPKIGATSGTDFSFTSEPSSITKDEKDLASTIAESYDSVPTMVGTVSLDPSASSEPLEVQAKKAAGKFTESEVN